jgi:hypothetical protein
MRSVSKDSIYYLFMSLLRTPFASFDSFEWRFH